MSDLEWMNCEDYDASGSQMRQPCTKCGEHHPARFAEDIETVRAYRMSKFVSALTPIKLPKRPDKVPLTPYQKQMIKQWKQPFATTSAKCDYCLQMYSSGYLKVCPSRPEFFCGSKPYVPPEPKGYSDDELGFYFGITREELDEN